MARASASPRSAVRPSATACPSRRGRGCPTASWFSLQTASSLHGARPWSTSWSGSEARGACQEGSWGSYRGRSGISATTESPVFVIASSADHSTPAPHSSNLRKIRRLTSAVGPPIYPRRKQGVFAGAALYRRPASRRLGAPYTSWLRGEMLRASMGSVGIGPCSEPPLQILTSLNPNFSARAPYWRSCVRPVRCSRRRPGATCRDRNQPRRRS
jgi:hypothetical protein